jgi:hypothetical protein
VILSIIGGAITFNAANAETDELPKAKGKK